MPYVFNPFTGTLDWTSPEVSAPLSLISHTQPQLTIGYDVSNKTTYSSGSNGRMTLASTGSDPAVWYTFNGDIRTKISSGGISILYEFAAIDITTFGAANAGTKYGWNGNTGIGDGGVLGQLALMAGGTDSVFLTTSLLRSIVPIRFAPYTVATLPSASSSGAGATAYVSDSLAAPIYNATAVGGGVVFAKVSSNGTTWLYA